MYSKVPHLNIKSGFQTPQVGRSSAKEHKIDIICYWVSLDFQIVLQKNNTRNNQLKALECCTEMCAKSWWLRNSFFILYVFKKFSAETVQI